LYLRTKSLHLGNGLRIELATTPSTTTRLTSRLGRGTATGSSGTGSLASKASARPTHLTEGRKI
jgi:hypothetical protein